MNTFHSTSRVVAVGCFVLLSIATAFAQTPKLINAKTETRAASSDLSAQLQEIARSQQSPAWIGYFVPATEDAGHQMCCNTYNDGQLMSCGCRLEDEHGSSYSSGETNRSDSRSDTVKLEGARQLAVMFRAEHGTINRIRTFSEDCQLDAGGLTVIWLTGVSPRESVAVLTPFATMTSASSDFDDNKVNSAALAAIAFTGDPAADSALQGFVAPTQSEWLREHTAFWLGAARGHAGFEVLQKLARSDASDDLRAKVAFDLFVSKDPAATDEIVRMAKTDESSHAREQAIFWVAQKAGRKAEAAITTAIENDPNTEVKKRAVFALSQLPKEEGVPLLIQVAKTNANPAVRKQAIFWLGQSHDPRALAFFEEILAR